MADHIKHNRRRPRSWWSLFIRLGGWSALVLGVILLVITTVGHFIERKADRFEADGVVVTGTVIGRRIEIGTDSDGDETREYYLSVNYATRAAQNFKIETDVSRRIYRRHAEGDEIELRYLEPEPDRIEIPVGKNRATSGILWWIGLGLGLGGLALLWRFGRQATGAILARRDGDELLAEVTGIHELNLEINDVRQGRLAWLDEDGRPGESLMHGLPTLRRYNPGDIITVYRRGNDVWWQGDVGPPARDVKPPK